MTRLAAEYQPDVLLAHLHDAGVDFVVIGGVALTLHGGATVTRDTDIFFRRDRENIQRLAEALSELDVRLRDFPEGLPFTPDAQTLHAGTDFTFTTRFGWLDCLAKAGGIGSYDELSRDAVTMNVGDRSYKVASVDDLIRMKRAANRAKDQNPLLELEEIRRLHRAEEP